MRELRDEEGDAADHHADQREVEPEQQTAVKAEVRLESRPAEVREDAGDPADEQQGDPHRGDLLDRHPSAGARHRQEHVERAALFLAPEHAAGGEQGPHADEEDEDADLEGGVAADRVRGHRVGIPGKLRRQAGQRRARLRGGDQRGHARHRRDDHKTHAYAPAQDRDPVVAQRLEEDAPKHLPSVWRAAHPSRSSAGRCPRGSARSWSGR